MLLARKLSVEDFGLFYAVLGFLGPIAFLKSLGVNKAVTKFTPEFRVQGEWGKIKESINWAVIVSLGTSVITAGTVYFLTDWIGDVFFKTDKAAPFFKIMLLYFVVTTLAGVFSAFFMGMKKPLLLSSRALLVNALICIAIFFINNLDLTFLGFVYIVIEAVILAFLVFNFLRIFDYPNISTSTTMNGLKKLLSFGLPATTTPMVNKFFGRLDIIILTYFKDLGEVGVYSAAQPFARLFAILGSSVGKMMFPYSSEMISSGHKRELRQIAGNLQRLLLFLLAPLAIVFIMFSSDLLSLLFGQDFKEGSLVVRLLVAGAFIHTLTIINVNILNGVGHPLKVTKLMILNSTFNLGGNILLIPAWGMVGAALSTLIAYWAMFWGSCLYIKALIGHSFDWPLLGKLSLPSLIMIITLMGANLLITDNIFVLFVVFLPISLTFYFTFSLLLKIIYIDEVSRISRKIRGLIPRPST